MAYIFVQTCCSYPTDGFVLIFVISLYLSLLIEARETEARVMLTFMALDNSEKQKDGNELKKHILIELKPNLLYVLRYCLCIVLGLFPFLSQVSVT